MYQLNNYSICLMLIAFMQWMDILPCLQTDKKVDSSYVIMTESGIVDFKTNTRFEMAVDYKKRNR